MSEFIERVATAIVKAQDDWAAGVLHPLSRGSIRLQRGIYAIEAMRDPTDGMARKASEETDTGDKFSRISPQDCADIYRNMIDAAL